MEAKEGEEIWRHQKLTEEEEEEEDEAKDMRVSNHSLSFHGNPDCSPLIQRRPPPLKIKRKRIPKMHPSLKSKAKQLASDKSGKSTSCRRKRTRIDDLYDNADAKFSVMERAEGTQANLAADSPSFIKCMLPSNVSYGFWLILPKKFCNLHLPRHDTTLTLVDEWEEEYQTNYLFERHGLSGGWRRFSIDHRLLKGDRLVFHLIGPCKLKVNIVRVYGLDEVDAALCLMNIVAGTNSNNKKKSQKKGKIGAEPFVLDEDQENIQLNSPSIFNSKLGYGASQSENNGDFGSELSEGSEVSDHLQANELCCSQKSFQHETTSQGQYSVGLLLK